MSWNYRLVKIKSNTGEDYIEIKEIYYDKNNCIKGYSEAPIPYGENKDEVKQCLDLMYTALNKPIINESDLKAKE